MPRSSWDFGGQGQGTIPFRNPVCSGNEQWLIECPENNTGTAICSHQDDVGVICQLIGNHACSQYTQKKIFKYQTCNHSWAVTYTYNQKHHWQSRGTQCDAIEYTSSSYCVRSAVWSATDSCVDNNMQLHVSGTEEKEDSVSRTPCSTNSIHKVGLEVWSRVLPSAAVHLIPWSQIQWWIWRTYTNESSVYNAKKCTHWTLKWVYQQSLQLPWSTILWGGPGQKNQ